jgi:hypothetical protein
MMATTTSKFVWPLLMAVLVLLLVVSGSTARRLEGDTPLAANNAGGHSVIQYLKHLYLQQLAQPCPSGKSWDPNIGACH